MVEFFTTTNLGIVLLVLGQCLLVLVPLLTALAFLLLADRKVWAAVMMRRGPNVVGAFGLLQSFADFIKYIFKEVVIPAGADKIVFLMAPMMTFVLAVIAWAVIPFNDRWVLADINVAILYVFAVSTLEVYGVIMGGWASNSKYPFLGSLRSAAQMISYEVSIGLIIVGVILSTGSLNFGDIVAAQDGAWGIFNWYWLPHFPMVFLFFISALAETNRPPFDLPGGGLPDGIFLDAVPAVHDRRADVGGADVRAGLADVLRRLAVAHSGAARRDLLAAAEDGLFLLHLRHGESDHAALPL
jgi:NADH-quinone oxidoreductase subunit H